MHDYDVVVIGSGLGGSSAAAHLAAVGQRVLLLERYSVLGGSSHVYRRQGKWEWDCGVHYIGDCGPNGQTPTLLRGLGLDDHISWLPLDTDAFDRVVGPDLEFRLPVGWDRFLASAISSFPDDERGLRRMVMVLRAMGEPFDRDVTPASTGAYGAWLRAVGPGAVFAHLPIMSLFVACRLSPRTILALSVYCGLMGSTPTSATTSMYAILLHNYIGGGAYYPQGGGQTLSAAFADVTASHGGTIRRNCAVERILIDNNKVHGVRLDDGEIITAPAVVSAADILRTYRDLVGSDKIPRLHRARVSRLTMSRPFINAFFGIDLDLAAAPNCNFFAIPSWDDASSLLSLAKMDRALLGGKGHSSGEDWATQVAARQPMFVQSSSRRDPTHRAAAPPGHATVEVQSIVPYDPTLWGVSGYNIASHRYRFDSTYRNIKEILLEGMAQRMEQAFPGSASKIVISELGTPATQQRYVGNSNGAPFGLDVSPTQSGPFRPGVTTPIDGLYLAGTSTAWGPATEGAMLSGRRAASALIGRDLSAEVRDGTILTDRTKLAPWPADFDTLRRASIAVDKH